MKRNIAFVSSFSILLLVSNFSIALAQTATVKFTDRGWYDAAGNGGPHGPIYSSYPAGDNFFPYRNFFVFDLSGVSKPIGSAKLALSVPSAAETGYVSADPSENYELNDVITPISTLMAGGGKSAYADLGNGVVYGDRTMTAADMGMTIEVTLNASAIAAMNATHGLFAIGGSITTLDDVPNNEMTFFNSGDPTDVTELRLTLVPEPTIAALFAFAAMIFGVRRSRKPSI